MSTSSSQIKKINIIKDIEGVFLLNEELKEKLVITINNCFVPNRTVRRDG